MGSKGSCNTHHYETVKSKSNKSPILIDRSSWKAMLKMMNYVKRYIHF